MVDVWVFAIFSECSNYFTFLKLINTIHAENGLQLNVRTVFKHFRMYFRAYKAYYRLAAWCTDWCTGVG